MTESQLTLSGMRFHAYHGCLPEEAVRGGEYRVDFSCPVDTAAASSEDNLGDTLDYAQIYAAVQSVMGRRVNLIETLAENIVREIAEKFPWLETFTLSVSKIDPPVGGPCEAATVTITYRR